MQRRMQRWQSTDRGACIPAIPPGAQKRTVCQGIGIAPLPPPHVVNVLQQSQETLGPKDNSSDITLGCCYLACLTASVQAVARVPTAGPAPSTAETRAWVTQWTLHCSLTQGQGALLKITGQNVLQVPKTKPAFLILIRLNLQTDVRLIHCTPPQRPFVDKQNAA